MCRPKHPYQLSKHYLPLTSLQELLTIDCDIGSRENTLQNWQLFLTSCTSHWEEQSGTDARRCSISWHQSLEKNTSWAKYPAILKPIDTYTIEFLNTKNIMTLLSLTTSWLHASAQDLRKFVQISLVSICTRSKVKILPGRRLKSDGVYETLVCWDTILISTWCE